MSYLFPKKLMKINEIIEEKHPIIILTWNVQIFNYIKHNLVEA